MNNEKILQNKVEQFERNWCSQFVTDSHTQMFRTELTALLDLAKQVGREEAGSSERICSHQEDPQRQLR